MTRPEQLKAIKNCLTADTKADELRSHEADALLYHCALSIEATAVGSSRDWPDEESMHRLAHLEQGFGDWLGELADAIEAAPIVDPDRALWRVAFNGAVAVVHANDHRKFVSLFE